MAGYIKFALVCPVPCTEGPEIYCNRMVYCPHCRSRTVVAFVTPSELKVIRETNAP